MTPTQFDRIAEILRRHPPEGTGKLRCVGIDGVVRYCALGTLLREAGVDDATLDNPFAVAVAKFGENYGGAMEDLFLPQLTEYGLTHRMARDIAIENDWEYNYAALRPPTPDERAEAVLTALEKYVE